MPISARPPRSFSVSPANISLRRRAVFSRSVLQVSSHHVAPYRMASGGEHPRRRNAQDEALRLIDDLTNRPVDQLFFDARLTRRQRSTFSVWSTRVVVFVICIVVGFSGSLFVQQLQEDPRKEIRRSLAAELVQQRSTTDSLSQEVSKLRQQVERESRVVGSSGEDADFAHDEMLNGFTKVSGQGITMTLANPLAAGGDSANHALSGDSSGGTIKVVTDSDLQLLVSLMWQSGAEAISVNDQRIGVQTSIRTAGGIILVGVHQIASPYTIEAIGPRDDLARNLGSSTQRALYDSFKEAGIYPQITRTNAITLEAADSGDVSYAKVRK